MEKMAKMLDNLTTEMSKSKDRGQLPVRVKGQMNFLLETLIFSLIEGITHRLRSFKGIGIQLRIKDLELFSKMLC